MTRAGHKYILRKDNSLYKISCKKCGQDIELVGHSFNTLRLSSRRCPVCRGSKYMLKNIFIKDGIKVYSELDCSYLVSLVK